MNSNVRHANNDAHWRRLIERAVMIAREAKVSRLHKLLFALAGPDCGYCWTSQAVCDSITEFRLTGTRVRCCVECEDDGGVHVQWYQQRRMDPADFAGPPGTEVY